MLALDSQIKELIENSGLVAETIMNPGPESVLCAVNNVMKYVNPDFVTDGISGKKVFFAGNQLLYRDQQGALCSMDLKERKVEKLRDKIPEVFFYNSCAPQNYCLKKNSGLENSDYPQPTMSGMINVPDMYHGEREPYSKTNNYFSVSPFTFAIYNGGEIYLDWDKKRQPLAYAYLERGADLSRIDPRTLKYTRPKRNPNPRVRATAWLGDERPIVLNQGDKYLILCLVKAYEKYSDKEFEEYEARQLKDWEKKGKANVSIAFPYTGYDLNAMLWDFSSNKLTTNKNKVRLATNK